MSRPDRKRMEHTNVKILAISDVPSKALWDLCRMKNAKDGIPLVFCIEGDIDNKVAILDQKTEAYKVLWPLDQNILDNDSALEQTPGYE